MSLRHAVLGLLATEPSTRLRARPEVRGARSPTRGTPATARSIRSSPSWRRRGWSRSSARARAAAAPTGSPARAARSCAAGCWRPSRTARSATRPLSAGSSSRCSTPPIAASVLERELEHAEAYQAMLRETARAHRRAGGHAVPPTVDLGLRTTAVMRDWLREQLDASSDGA